MRKDKDYLPKLLEYIEIANKIPSDFIFPAKYSIFEITSERLGKTSLSFDELIESFKLLLKSFPKDLYDYVFTTDSNELSEQFEQIQKKVSLLLSLSYGLATLAYFVTEEYLSQNTEFELSVNDYLEGLKADMPEYVADFSVEVFVNEEGFLRLNTTDFYDFIANHNIEARRIRTCLICSKIFWAKRVETWYCSKTCGNTLRQRMWQLGNKEEYNEKRRKNYAYKQSIKKQKEKKNGTL